MTSSKSVCWAGKLTQGKVLVSKPASMSLSPPNSYGGRELAPAHGSLASTYVL